MDAEWALVAPMIQAAKHGGRPRRMDVRKVLNELLYVLWTGCQRSALPKGLAPKRTVRDDFSRWE
jgi:putative transposase